MSPFFVRFFKSHNPCPYCPERSVDDKAPHKSMCKRHLAMARVHFRIWSVERRRHRLCIACSDASDGRNCRCPKHREMNRMKCARWADAQTAEQHTARKQAQREKWLAVGRCYRCPQHRRLGKFKECRTCRVARQACVHGDLRAVREVRRSVYAFRRDRERARVRAWRQQLQQLRLAA